MESVRLYGLHDRRLERIVEWYTSREAAERELEAILAGELDIAETLDIAIVELQVAVEPPAQTG